MQGQYAAPPVPWKMARRDHHRTQPAGPSAAAACIRAYQSRRPGRAERAAEADRRRHHARRASELHSPPVLLGLAGRWAARPGSEDGGEEQVRARAGAGGDRPGPAAGPGRHRCGPGTAVVAATRSSSTVAMAHLALSRAITRAQAKNLVLRNVSALTGTPPGQQGRPSRSM